MTSLEAHRIREHMLSLKAWIEHWQADRACNLLPTESSLTNAKAHADYALTLVNLMEQHEAVQ